MFGTFCSVVISSIKCNRVRNILPVAVSLSVWNSVIFTQLKVKINKFRNSPTQVRNLIFGGVFLFFYTYSYLLHNVGKVNVAYIECTYIFLIGKKGISDNLVLSMFQVSKLGKAGLYFGQSQDTLNNFGLI